MTPSGIEPATLPFVAQHLNHCATAGLHIYNYTYTYSLFIFRTECNVPERRANLPKSPIQRRKLSRSALRFQFFFHLTLSSHCVYFLLNWGVFIDCSIRPHIISIPPMFRLHSGTKEWKNFMAFPSSQFCFSWANILSFPSLASTSVISEAKNKEKLWRQTQVEL